MTRCWNLPRWAPRCSTTAASTAKKYNVELEVISSINPVPGTIVKEETKVEGMLIKGVAKDNDVAVVSIKNVPDVPGMSFKVFSLLAQKNITWISSCRAPAMRRARRT